MSDGDDRARQRAEDRERRARERVAAAVARTEQRAAQREVATHEREAARLLRRQEDEQRRAALAAERVERPRRRSSGALARTGEKPIERDTRHYTPSVDPVRLRTLAARGANPDALAAVFGITVAQVEAILADDA